MTDLVLNCLLNLSADGKIHHKLGMINFEKYDMKVSKKAKIRNPYNQDQHLTQDTTWESDKNTRKHHVQESQEVNPFPVGAMNRQESMTNTKHK